MSTNGSPAPQPYQSPTAGHIEGRNAPMYNQRRVSSTGGGRAWSEEEENYLIETRQHKMPYKHIAAHLQKTELACRLHYHQLSFGTKRRRRTSSVSSARSACSATSIESRQQRPLPALSPPDSPESTPHGSVRSQSPNHNPVPILPKPVAHLHHPHSIQPSNALRLITQDIERYEERSRINKDRLSRIYDAHRNHFWATVARDYGDNVSPAVLEDVWRRGYANPTSAALYPPTPPNRSPSSPKAALAPAFDCPPPTSFQPVNLPRSVQTTPNAPSRGSFAIASLLTEDKEVRSPN